jgi:hypothetical protein
MEKLLSVGRTGVPIRCLASIGISIILFYCIPSSLASYIWHAKCGDFDVIVLCGPRMGCNELLQVRTVEWEHSIQNYTSCENNLKNLQEEKKQNIYQLF